MNVCNKKIVQSLFHVGMAHTCLCLDNDHADVEHMHNIIVATPIFLHTW